MNKPATIEEIKRHAKGKCPVEYMKELGIETFAEIGIREGNSFFDSHIKGVANGGIAYGIDIWQDTGNPAQNDANFPQSALDRQYTMCINKSSIHNASVLDEGGAESVIVREFSAKAPVTLGLEQESLDWVFIDGDHSYEGCKEDIEAWWPLVKPGGVLCGHDYMLRDVYWNGVRCGVKEAVDEFFADKDVEVFVYENSPNPTWYTVKPLTGDAK